MLYKSVPYSRLTKSPTDILVPYITSVNSTQYGVYKKLHNGVDISGSTIYAAQKGSVIRVGSNTNNTYYAVVQISSCECIRYDHLSSTILVPGQEVIDGGLIGVAKQYLHLEYLTTEKGSSIESIRIGTVTYYKQDPEFLIDSEPPRTDVTELLDYTQLTPYIATIDNTVTSVDYEALKSAGVSCVMFDTTDESDLESKIHQAGMSYMDYGLIVTSSANSIESANIELQSITLLVQKYIPPYGVWVNLNLTSSRISVNNKILDRYQYVLESLGLKGKIGLHVTRDQLKRIDWSEDRQSAWYLWLIDRVDDISHINQMLSPEYFFLDPSKSQDTSVINTSGITPTEVER